jgi:hypothetical protein
MIDVDLSKTVKITVAPRSSLDLTYERVCRECALKYPRKDGTYPAANAKEVMTHCLGECDSKIKRGYESGNPFEIEIVPVNYQRLEETQPEPEPETEKIPKAPQSLFFHQG